MKFLSNTVMLTLLLSFQVHASSLQGTEMEDFRDKNKEGKRLRKSDTDPVKNKALLKKYKHATSEKPLTKPEKARQMDALDLGGPCSGYNFSKMIEQRLEELF